MPPFGPKSLAQMPSHHNGPVNFYVRPHNTYPRMATQKTPTAAGDALPSPQDFCLATPLYQAFKFNNEQENPFFSLEHFDGTLDMHCPECGRHSIFGIARKAEYSRNSYFSNYVFSLPFMCSRDNAHRAMFIFYAHKGILQKIGQTPSLAELAIPDLKKYRPVLGDERFRELSRGIGLATHGVGVGAFVYLRRIFESLIDSAHEAAKLTENWSEEDYVRSRMEDRISLLKGHLPDFLVKNRGLYGILSVGVHTLSEADCLAAFPAVRLAIELILDDLLEQRERRTKLTSAAKALEALKASAPRGGA